jgi:hypothetical protein
MDELGSIPGRGMYSSLCYCLETKSGAQENLRLFLPREQGDMIVRLRSVLN